MERKSDFFQVGVSYQTPKGNAEVFGFIFADDNITIKKVVMKKGSKTFKISPDKLKRIGKMNVQKLKNEIRLVIRDILENKTLRHMIRNIILQEIKTNVISVGLELFDSKGVLHTVYDMDNQFIYIDNPDGDKFKVSHEEFERSKWEIR